MDDKSLRRSLYCTPNLLPLLMNRRMLQKGRTSALLVYNSKYYYTSQCIYTRMLRMVGRSNINYQAIKNMETTKTATKATSSD